ncbi:MAG: NAD(P)/FAD-dependent oxidoreductase [Acidobacteriota bacterium]
MRDFDHIEDDCLVVVVGGGPAGLTAAAELVENGRSVIVLEKDPWYVGGLARTVQYKGYRFDIGGHRFFSKSPEIVGWWRRRLPDDFVWVKRLSRIYYRGKFFDYPLRAGNALFGLGLWTSAACAASYLKARLSPIRPENSFADWVTNRFGARLFDIFFKTYTEKVWGMPCTEISADWAAQRIKGLSLSKAVLNALLPGRNGSDGAVKTLIERFHYPRLGPGMMWEKTRDDLLRRGARVQMGEEVIRIAHRSQRVLSIRSKREDGEETEYSGRAFISSMPLRDCILAFDPPLPNHICEAALRLQYRDFLTVALVVDQTDLFPDNWIYVHDPGVKLGRIQNFNNWSRQMVPNQSTTCLGLEYFCFTGDGLWSTPDPKLIDLGKSELAKLGLVQPEKVLDGCVVRMDKAYPVYYPGYQEDLRTIRSELQKFENFQVIGRNGMHKYNNQDHSMMTALLAARNLSGDRYDLWKVNTDAEYHEEGEDEVLPRGRVVPEKAARTGEASGSHR